MFQQFFTGILLLFVAFLLFTGGVLAYLGALGIGILFLLVLFIFNRSYLTVPNRDICNLVPSSSLLGTELFVSPSFWTAQLFFFTAYLIQNAMSLYNQESEVSADKRKVQNRKDQALTTIIVTSIVVPLLVLIRYNTTGCETAFGIAVSALTMIPLGIGWYKFAETCGIRHADVFGIAGKMLSVSAKEPPPMMCVNTSTA